MRLTLRTLLAYLDDRLPPANARELGQKIVNSPFATELADRIKSVVRRRRLAKDASDQKNIDANLIAEYLDDQLTPELVALIEKEILGSDHNLAEVAAAHQILGLLSDPVEISQQLTERFHKLDPFTGAKADAPSDVAPVSEDNAWKPLAPQSVAARRSPMLLLGLMVVGWLALLFTDSNLFSNGDTDTMPRVPAEGAAQVDIPDPGPAANDANANTVVAAAEPGENVAPFEQKASVAANAPATNTAPESAIVKAELGATVTTNGLDNSASPTTDIPAIADATPANAAAEAANMQPDSKSGVPGTSPATDAPKTDAKPETPPPTAVAQVFEVRDENRMHILHDSESGKWDWAVKADAEVINDWGPRLTSNVSAVSDPFRMTVTCRDAGWAATVLGSSLFRVVDGSASGMELLDGRMVLHAHGANDTENFALYANGRLITIQIPDTGKNVGVSVIPLTGNTPAIDEPGDLSLFPFGGPAIVTLFAADSDVSFTVENAERPIVLRRGKAWQWNTAGNVPDANAAAGALLIPEWVFQSTDEPPASVNSLMTNTATTLRAETSIETAAQAMSADRNPQLATYGVRLTALTRNVDQLIAYLLQQNEEGVRHEAIFGLRMIIRQSESGLERVSSGLETRLSNTELDNAMKMLEGVSRTAAEDRFVSGWLVEMLSSGRAAMRDMAIVNLEELTRERYNFFADDDAGRRTSAVRRWERYLERNDGRLVKPIE